MLRCHYCGSHAMVGLAHFHGLPYPLCKECSDRAVLSMKFVSCSCHARTANKLQIVPKQSRGRDKADHQEAA